MALLAAGIVYYALSLYIGDRERFVADYQTEECRVSRTEESSGKNSSYYVYLSCPKTERRDDVSRSTYESSKSGDVVTVYYSKSRPDVWMRLQPSSDWIRELALRTWAFYVSGVVILGVVVGYAWQEAKNECEFLSRAARIQAEVLDVHVQTGKVSGLEVEVKYFCKGVEYRKRLNAPTSMSGSIYKVRNVQLNVDTTNPENAKIHSDSTMCEFVD